MKKAILQSWEQKKKNPASSYITSRDFRASFSSFFFLVGGIVKYLKLAAILYFACLIKRWKKEMERDEIVGAKIGVHG